ncbi:unnamed protein product [Brugia pahangi]|uniref:Alpha-1,3-glucosyltransferase n=1 Tax=Brugia pahangi TaxID=6280 RepID=A0A0N4TYF4_BRUPA|nr:unnamed protein product [Brugia pahangi]
MRTNVGSVARSEMKEAGMDVVINRTNQTVFFIVLCFAFTLQIALSLGSYSGHATPPMYGDYEAQRHWMEITYHLPINQWYVNGSDNDLNYWGLDYPPLTAYHSWLLGTLANKLNRSWIELRISRGMETETHKIFMRFTVVATFWIVYVSSLLLSIGFFHNTLSHRMLNYCAIAVLYPGLLVVDSGHFQYNHVSLGLFLFSFACFVSSFLKLGSMLFVLSLSFKQMELYHALPVAIYLLSESFSKQLLILFITVIVTILFVCFPFLITRSDLMQILYRIFPFYRGIFEDKVANFWYPFLIFAFLNFILLDFLLVVINLVLITNIPWSVCLFCHPTRTNFKYCLLASSLSFFLFSFQVHEKSILLVALPAILLWNENPVLVSWLLIISNIRLYIFAVVLTPIEFDTLCLASLLFAPPARFPHIFSLLIAVYCFLHFITFFLYINLVTLLFRFKKLEIVDLLFTLVHEL